jgi:hypothetical protein
MGSYFAAIAEDDDDDDDDEDDAEEGKRAAADRGIGPKISLSHQAIRKLHTNCVHVADFDAALQAKDAVINGLRSELHAAVARGRESASKLAAATLLLKSTATTPKKTSENGEAKQAGTAATAAAVASTLAKDNASLCAVCLTLDRSVVFLPCAHLCVCLACSAELQQCVVCRQAASSKIRVFV